MLRWHLGGFLTLLTSLLCSVKVKEEGRGNRKIISGVQFHTGVKARAHSCRENVWNICVLTVGLTHNESGI